MFCYVVLLANISQYHTFHQLFVSVSFISRALLIITDKVMSPLYGDNVSV